MGNIDQIIQAAAQHMNRGQRDQARALLQSALAQAPTHPIANQYMGMFHAQGGNLPEAVRCMEAAAAAMPGNPALLCNLGMLRSAIGRHDEAAADFEAAIRLKPDYADPHACLGIMRANQQRAADAERHFLEALRLAPARGDVVYAYTRTLTETGRAEEAVAILRSAQQATPDDLLLQSKVCMMLNYVDGVTPESLHQEHVRFGALAPKRIADFSAVDADPDRRLRVGYLSADLREHSVAYFLEPLLESRDRSAFEVFCYHVGTPDERATPRLMGKSDHWRAMFPSSDDALLAHIAEDRIDILIELGGHTSGNRLSALARRAAPLQVSYIGYPNTTGLPAMDARIVDGITDPPGADRFATERLIRLPGCFLCYRPPEAAPDVAPPPTPAGSPVTFGSFNSLAKLSPTTIALWSEILAAVPGSRLILKGKALSDPSVASRFIARFAERGVDAQRLDLLGHTQGVQEHLTHYARVDIALDPFPYNGTTTTCEALWMGVPVVSLAGGHHAARVGLSLLSRVGLSDLVAPDPAGYVRLAVGLANDPARRALLRSSLRGRLRASPLCDAAAFAPAFESALRELWRGWCAARAASPSA